MSRFAGEPPYAFGPDEARVLTGRTNGAFQPVDVRSGSVKRVFPSRVKASPDGAEISRSGRHVRVQGGRSEGSAEVWSLVTGQLVAAVATGFHCAGAVFSPDGRRMAFPGADTLLRIWDLDQENVLMSVPIQAAARGWSQAGAKLVVVRPDLQIEELDGSPWSSEERRAVW